MNARELAAILANPPRMVGWFNPAQLARTAVDVAISTIFGRHADRRLIEAMTLRDDPAVPFIYPKRSQGDLDEFWIDYVSDVGDGWNSTCGVAHWFSREELRLQDDGGKEFHTRRGHVLVLGGDEVYPAASRKDYEERLVNAYDAALATARPAPDVFAIPGNHDWYDSLVAFSRLFMSSRHIGAWRTRQKRSYFALRLPHGWWLLAIDVQLGSDIDVLQEEYFREIARQIAPHEQIILCSAEPEWIYGAMYGRYDQHLYSDRALRHFEARILKRHADVLLAGDLHHYRRHESASKTGPVRHKITAGGGGAFLHPTHGPDVLRVGAGRESFHIAAAYPAPDLCRRLTWRNLWFPVNNPSFLWLSGLIYLFTAWAMKPERSAQAAVQGWGDALHQTLLRLIDHPPAAFWTFALLAGFWFFTDTHSPRYRMIGGSLHGIAHLVAVFFISWGSFFLSRSDEHGTGLLEIMLTLMLVFAGGAVTGSFILGLYLLVSLNLFGRHSNEAFSALAIEDWKSFLRLRINRDGLTLFPVGIDRVPRKWRAEGDEAVPDDPRATPPRLIESPIFIPRRPSPVVPAERHDP